MKIKNLLLTLVKSSIRNIDGRLGIVIRRKFYAKRFGKCGDNLQISKGVIFEGIKNIYIGDNVWIDNYCILIAGKVDFNSDEVKILDNKNFLFNEGELHLGSNIHIAPQCIIQSHAGISIGDYFTASAGSKIYSLSNDVQKCHFGTHSDMKKGYVLSPISISDNVWLGLNAVVLGGNIEKNCFIATNSVVLKDISENSFVAGNPGKKMKNRF
jgi:galactoside O-acetyltransferase